MTFFITLFILLLQFIWKYIDEFVGKGFEWYVIAELLVYAGMTFVPLALPLSLLLSSIMTFGNLGEHYELVAMKSAGISLRKIMQPLVILSIVISISAFFFSNNILPLINIEMKALLRSVTEQKPTVSIKEGVFNSDLNNFSIRVEEKDEKTETVKNVTIYDHSKGRGNVNVTKAKSGKITITDDKQYLIFTLYDGINYNENIENQSNELTRPMQRTKFREEVRRIDLSEFEFVKEDPSTYESDVRSLDMSHLQVAIDSLVVMLDDKKSNLSKFIINNYRQFVVINNLNNFTDRINAKKSINVNKNIKEQYVNNIITKNKNRKSSDITVHNIVKEDDGISEKNTNSKNNDSLDKKTNLKKNTPQNIDPEKKINKTKKNKNKKNPNPQNIVNNEFNRNILANQQRDKYRTKIDTLKPLMDDFLNNFNKTEKIRIVNNSMNTARNMKHFLDSYNYEISQKSELMRKHKIEWHRKLTLSFACFILFFIGAPLGAIIRKGGIGLPTVVSVVFFIIFHVISMIGEKSAREGVIEVYYGMWLSSAVLLPIGVFLTFKATTDSQLLDADTWKKIFKRIFFRKNKAKAS